VVCSWLRTALLIQTAFAAPVKPAERDFTLRLFVDRTMIMLVWFVQAVAMVLISLRLVRIVQWVRTRNVRNVKNALHCSIPRGTVLWGWIDCVSRACHASYQPLLHRVDVNVMVNISRGIAIIAALIMLAIRFVLIEYLIVLKSTNIVNL